MELEPLELPADLKARVDEQIDQALGLEEQHLFAEATRVYKETLSLIPEPRHAYWEAMRIYVGFGEIHFAQQQFEQAMPFYRECFKMPEGYLNSFVLLRVGETAFELEDFITAAEHLTRALMLDGPEIFEEDPRYFDFLKTVLKAPPGGW
ncbi:hypothetical protein [Deinococcus cellulosilyticus]|uniref:Uncharacterized protein n=1 Tax=Deinococcus cellulosilyticus (strain DSM 18568 / NBRC 106333 / KACC 11606 / 5516J-15) TaxID=1223518 RepID=A0A511MX26_DEIC1|nr:hypothetical protein [Deinococcus cellulosilyticus]GEM45135.1 hypothetical protein DC3_07700 [Deinococcus cellulosilyticus NBRC 106333 = KACC 11606]